MSHHLGLHPEIWMPPLKEIHYFDEKVYESANVAPRLLRKLLGGSVVDRRWRRQVRRRSGRYLRRVSRKRAKTLSREDLRWDLRYYAGRPDDRWYAALFEPGRGKVVGEITPSYSMLGPDAVAHVNRLMPDAKIIFMMRNPIERAWSQAVMHFGKIEKRAVASVGEDRLRRNFESEGSLLRTDYLQTLEVWREFYQEDRIFVGFLEDVSMFPAELLSRLYAFLDVDPSFRPTGVEGKVHSRSASRAPADALVYLARLHRGDTARLSGRFGGYADFWRHCAERLSEHPPSEESLPYPLWESFLWEDWINGAGATVFREDGPRSQPLSSF